MGSKVLLNSKLHEKQAEVVAQVYKALVEALWAGQSFVSLMELAGEPSKEQKYNEGIKYLRNFYMLFETHPLSA